MVFSLPDSTSSVVCLTCFLLLSALAAAYSYLWASPLKLPYVDTITAILTQWVENPY